MVKLLPKQIIMEFQLSSILMVIFNTIKNCKFNQKIFKDISRNKYWSDYLDVLSGGLKNETTQLVIEKLGFWMKLKVFIIIQN